MPVRRFGAIDSARGTAVVLAMLSHALVQFGNDAQHVKFLTRMATPAFMILFGAMIEIAYLRKLRAGADASARTAVVERLLSRMLTCYIVFAMIALAALVTDKVGMVGTIKALLFLEQGRFGNILRIYAVLFAIVIAVLPLAVRYGAAFFVWAAGGAWALKYALDGLGAPAIGPLQNIFGHAEGFGPAVLPGLTFVAFGMLIGEYVTGRRSLRAAAAMAAVAAAALAAQAANLGPGALTELVISTYRWNNHPFYFAFGIVSTSAILGVFWLLWLRPDADPVSRTLAGFGRDTLFIYGFGNVALNLLPSYEGSAAIGLALTAAFLAGLFCLSLDQIGGRPFLNRFMLRLPEGVAALYGRLLGTALPRVASVLTPRLG